MSVQYPKPNLLWLDHVLISGKIFAMICVVFFYILDPHHLSAWVGFPLTLVLWGTGAYFARSLYGYLKTLEVGHDDRTKLEAEIAVLKAQLQHKTTTLIDLESIHARVCDSANGWNGDRCKLQAEVFKAIGLLHSATRFVKSAEADKIHNILSSVMNETLDPTSSLRRDITPQKEVVS